MTKPLKKHRLFVSTPLFVTILCVSLISAFDYAKGVQGGVLAVQPLHDTAVQVGSALMNTDDILVVDQQVELQASADVSTLSAAVITVHNDELISLHGGYNVSRTKKSYVVSAITSPVLVRTETGAVHLVPIGMQFDRETGMRKPLPAYYMRERIAALTTLESAHTPSTEALLPLDQCADATTVQRARLLVETDKAGILPLALECAFSEPDVWSLALFHPQFASAAWVVPVPTSTSAAVLEQRRELLPLSDIHRTAVSSLAVRMWQQDWQDQLATASGALLLADQLPQYADAIATLDRKGFPERAQRYKDAVTALIDQSFIVSATEQAQAFLESIKEDKDYEDEEDDKEEEASAGFLPAEEEIVYAPANEQIALAKSILTNEGCMFTSQTSISYIEKSMLRISNVVIGGNAGDRLFSFIFDVRTQQVHNIIGADGKTLPYSMALQQFMSWAKR